MKRTADGAPIFQSDNFTIRSSIADDIWHDDSAPAGYEWWYFDAVSDDHRDCLVIIFLSNFVFSPRYQRFAQTLCKSNGDKAAGKMRFPAVAFSFYRDGRILLRAINEYLASEFSASKTSPQCRIANSKFELQTASNDVRYQISIDEPLRGGRKLVAHLSFILPDGDFEMKKAQNDEADFAANQKFQNHEWNLVAPRCRVEGAIKIKKANGAEIREYNFQGAGYHDHNRDSRPLTSGVESWQWGRAHFDNETTAIFYRYLAKEDASAKSLTKLLIARRGELTIYDARFSLGKMKRDLFGVSYPRELIFQSKPENNKPTVALRLSQTKLLDRSFFYLRFLTRAALETADGKILQAPAVTEHLAPRALNWRWLDWLVNMRIGSGGRAAFLP